MEKQKQEGPRYTSRENITQLSYRQLMLSIMNKQMETQQNKARQSAQNQERILEEQMIRRI